MLKCLSNRLPLNDVNRPMATVYQTLVDRGILQSLLTGAMLLLIHPLTFWYQGEVIEGPMPSGMVYR